MPSLSKYPGRYKFTWIFFAALAFVLAGCAASPTVIATPLRPSPVPTATAFPPTATSVPPTETPNKPASPQAAASAPVSTVGINIVEPPFKPPQSWTFEPMTVTVKVGTKITWINTGAVLHTVDSDDNQTFKSGDLQPQATFSFNATTAGTFVYHCHYHPWMKGALVVQP
jgi:plastocyanin